MGEVTRGDPVVLPADWQDAVSAQEANRAVLERFLRALDAGDADAVLDSYHDDAVIETMGTAVISGRRSKAEAAASLGALFGMFPNGLNFAFTSFTAQDDRVVCEAESHATDASGRSYRNRYAFVARVADGRIIHLREYMDTLMVERFFAP